MTQFRWRGPAGRTLGYSGWIGMSDAMARYLTIVFVLMLSAGCVPQDVYDTPPVHGEVFDAITHAPIQNANVTVRSEKPGVAAIATTNSTGYFEAKPAIGRGWRAIMHDYPLPNAMIEVAAAGYESQEVDFYTFNKSKRVYLEPQ